MRLYFKFIVLGIIVGILPSLIFPNAGFVLGGLVVGYLIADNYLDGVINGLVSQAIAGLLVSWIILLLMLIIFNHVPLPNSQLSQTDTLLFYGIFMGIQSAVLGSIIGAVFGILGVFINTSLKQKDKI